MTIRIYLAEDHHLVRQGTRLLLESEPDFEVVGEAEEGLQATQQVLRLRPDVLIVDIVLPDLNGIEVTREVKRRLPGLKVVALSLYDTDAYVIEAFKAGASAYVLKKSTAQELVQAVRQAMADKRYLSTSLNSLFDVFLRRSREEAPVDPYDSLTRRERQVLQMAAQGMNNPEIARRLLISVRTVEMHRANMLKKMGINGQTELVRYALKRGLVQ